jgi:hypothetical protein
MPSGLDDYPRAHIVNEGEEIHLDLQSWMIEFSSFMGIYAELVNDSKLSTIYLSNSKKIKDQL